jgi:hypothetical protein
MKLRFRFKKQSKNFFAFEPVDPSLAVGTLYLAKELFHDAAPPQIAFELTDDQALAAHNDFAL